MYYSDYPHENQGKYYWSVEYPQEKEVFKNPLYCNGKPIKTRRYKSSIEANFNRRVQRSTAVKQQLVELSPPYFPLNTFKFCKGSLHFPYDARIEDVRKIKSDFGKRRLRFLKSQEFEFEFSAIQHVTLGPTGDKLHFDFIGWHSCPYSTKWLKTQILKLWYESGGRRGSLTDFNGPITSNVNYIFKSSEQYKKYIRLPATDLDVPWQTGGFFKEKSKEITQRCFKDGVYQEQTRKITAEKILWHRSMRPKYLPDFETQDYINQRINERLKKYHQSNSIKTHLDAACWIINPEWLAIRERIIEETKSALAQEREARRIPFQEDATIL